MCSVRRVRLAILECDHSLDPDRSQYGGYGGLIKTWLNQQPAFRDNVDITIWDVENAREYPKSEQYDALLVTGSPTSVESGEEWVEELLQLVRNIVNDEQNQRRIIGICFGHQILGKALGSSVTVSRDGFESSLTEIQLTAEGKNVFGKSTIRLNQMHCDVVQSSQGVTSLGSTELCAVQGLYRPKKFISLQAHPEFDRATMNKVLQIMAEHEELTNAEFLDGVARNTGETDAHTVREAFARFLLEE